MRHMLHHEDRVTGLSVKNKGSIFLFPRGEKYQLVKSEGKLVVMVRLGSPVLTSVTHLDNKGQLVDEKSKNGLSQQPSVGCFSLLFPLIDY